MKTLFPVTLTESLTEARDFYVALFGFEVLVEISWYVHLHLPANEGMQIAFVQASHSSVPDAFRGSPAGVAITLEFDDVDVLFARATTMGLPIHVGLRDEEWGQRHFITQDPTGLMVDVAQPIAPSHRFLVENGLLDVAGSDS
ncbi:MAG: VOC family protein [Chloroflexota bacterium]